MSNFLALGLRRGDSDSMLELSLHEVSVKNYLTLQ